MNFRVVFLEQKVVPVAALVHDQAVAALQEPAATKAIRIGPLKGGPGAVTEQSYRGGRRKRYLRNVSRWNPAMAVRPTTGCKWDLIIDGVLGVQRGDTPASPALKRDSHCSTVSRADISTVYRANRCDGNRIDRQTHPGLTKPGDHRREITHPWNQAYRASRRPVISGHRLVRRPRPQRECTVSGVGSVFNVAADLLKRYDIGWYWRDVADGVVGSRCTQDSEESLGKLTMKS